jgi:hypothetical protein
LTPYEQLQTALNSERWRIQSEADRKRDMDILLAKIEEASENDEKMWVVLLSLYTLQITERDCSLFRS